MAGKGDKQRPVNKPKFDRNFDDIQWNHTNKQPIKKIKNNKGNAIRFVY